MSSCIGTKSYNRSNASGGPPAAQSARMRAMTASTAHGCVRRIELAPSAEPTGQFQMLRAHLEANGSRARLGPRRFGRDDVPCEPESCQQADHPEHRVELPRAAALHCGLRIGVM